MSVWQFVQDQVLGMRWLNTLINQLLTAVGLDTQTSFQKLKRAITNSILQMSHSRN